VYGSANGNKCFSELDKYFPRSPYSASKASSDHLVYSWHYSYELPITISNCTNNFGKYQFPDKLIPKIIMKALSNEKIPLYGNGLQIRDWLHVEDHIKAIIEIILNGNIGETYCIGANNEKTNKDLTLEIFNIINSYNLGFKLNNSSIDYVKDRPGHDKRYAIDASKIKENLNWSPIINFEDGLHSTVDWYLNNSQWCVEVMRKEGYRGERLGLI
tara:strand:- start:73 stop:717 length:645 start_codon:yes stop_codon:yes gene_type:complete